MSVANKSALILKTLHQRVNKPPVLANVFDTLSAREVAGIHASEALATS